MSAIDGLWKIVKRTKKGELTQTIDCLIVISYAFTGVADEL